MLKSTLCQSSELSTLNDDEVKRIMLVIERDFKLREKEYRRIEELKDIIRQEHERIECLANAEEFNYKRCLRCYKLFKFFFNPREICGKCKLYVCQNCAIYEKQSQTWTCKICLQLKELECLTADWFYHEIAKKYKRCGSAKVVRELHKREKELAETNSACADLEHRTLPIGIMTDSNDSGFLSSYIVHDENIIRELNEYSDRLNLIVDNLQFDLSNLHAHNVHLSIRNKYRENLKDHLQQITSEINRTRIALMVPLWRSNMKLNDVHANDLQNLLIHKTEEVLHTNLQQFKKSITASNTSVEFNNFDQKLAKLIFDNFIDKEVYNSLFETMELPSDFSCLPPKPQRQSSKPFSIDPSYCQLSEDISTSQIPNVSPKKSTKDSSRHILEKMNSVRGIIVDEEEELEDKTPTASSIGDENSDYQDEKNRFIDTDVETMKLSNERVDGWKTNFDLIERELTSLDNNDEDENLTTWL